MQEQVQINTGAELHDRLQAASEGFLRIAKRIFIFLSVSSIFIGMTGFFKTLIGYIFLNLSPNLQICSAVFLFSFSVYTLDKIADIDKDVTNMPDRLGFLSGRKELIKICALAAYLLAIILAALEIPQAIPIFIFPFIVNTLYGSKPFSNLPRLKDIPFIKNFMVALTWALETAILPAISVTNGRIAAIGSVFYFMLIKTFIDTVLYDVRDVKGDAESGVKTIPVIIGPRRTMGILLLLESTLLFTLPFIEATIRPLATMMIIFGFAYIIYFCERRNPLALDLCVEGEWMLAFCLLSLLNGLGFLI